jgi:hypothetical protein
VTSQASRLRPADPFISLVYKIEEAEKRWVEHNDTDGDGPVDVRGRYR